MPHAPARHSLIRPGEAAKPRPPRSPYDRTWRAFRKWFAGVEPAICAGILPDGTICGFAGRSDQMHLDHIVPIEQGGARLDPRNVRWMCAECHSRKTAKEDGGFGNE